MERIPCDCHLHTNFSPDSEAPPEAVIARAIQLGLKHIAITDHFDPKHPENYVGIGDERAYAGAIKALKEKYRGKIYVAVGVEIGYVSFTKEMAADFLRDPDVEYIINSVHVVDGIDCYNRSFYAGKTKEEAYGAYFKAVLDSVRVDYRYDAVGHMGYVERVAPYPDRRPEYEVYREYYDPIFDAIIEREAILELNTSTSSPLPCIPGPEILKAFYRRGGRLITLSSDAHTPDRIASRFDGAMRAAREAGFTYLTVKEDGKLRHGSI